MDLKEIGTFQIESGRIIISDPCYEADNGCNIVDVPAEIGEWKANVVMQGGRVAMLMAIHTGTEECDMRSILTLPFDVRIGVNSGQAGVYDQKYFKDDDEIDEDFFAGIHDKDRICPDEPWYSANCARTLGSEMAGIIPFGCVSSSGYGDGQYLVSGGKLGGTYRYLEIHFIMDKDEER